MGSNGCCFTGRVTKITLQGEGSAVFASGEPFSEGRAAKVELPGARIEGGPAGVTLVKPALLEPLPMSFEDQRYEVSYATAGKDGPVNLELDLPLLAPDAGRAASTNFKGALDGAPRCASQPCTVDWRAPRRTLGLLRADPTPMELTEVFPGHGGRLAKVQLEGARGSLRCKEDGGVREEKIDGTPLQWLTTNDGALVVQPIRLEGHALSVSIQNSTRPRPTTREAPSIPMAIPEGGISFDPGLLAYLGGGAISLALLAVVALRARKPQVTNTTNISGSVIGAIAIGDGATSTGHVVHTTTSPQPKPAAPPAASPAPAPTTGDRMNVLLVFSNPSDTKPLRLADEDRAVREAIKLSKARDAIEIESLHAASIDDLRRALIDKKRQVVHFAGHGEEKGLCFQNAAGETESPDAKALGALLKRHGVETVILNACYSNEMIAAAPMGTRYTVAMEGAIADAGALEFSRGFYDMIGAGRGVDEAYEEGVSCAAIKNVPVKAKLIPTPATS